MKFLLLALGKNSWGRGTVGKIVATDLEKAGHEIRVATHPAMAPVFQGTQIQIEEIANQFGSLSEMYLEAILDEMAPDAILFCDVPTADGFFSRHGIYADHMLRYGLPRVGIDLWDYREGGMVIDRDLTTRIIQPDWIKDLPQMLPVPILRPDARPGAFACLPERTSDPGAARKRWRERHKISDDKPTILFCTGTWQQASNHSGATQRIAEGLPKLIQLYIESLGPKVQFVHIGPAPWPGTTLTSYRWIPSLSAVDFEDAIHGADLFLSVNAAAASLAQALVADLPIALIQNRHKVLSVTQLPEGCTTGVKRWASSILPLSPFRLWPLNYSRFLEPILAENPYMEALTTLELLQEEEVVEGLRSLLFSSDARRLALARQRCYVEQVQNLPSASKALEALLAN